MEHPPHYLSDDYDPESRRFYWQMKEVAARMAMQIAASRRERAESDLRRRKEAEAEAARNAAVVEAYSLTSDRPSLARETGPDSESQLDRIERRLRTLETDVKDIRERMATKVELESVKDDVRIVAEGFAATNDHLKAIGARLDRIEERLDSLEDRMASIEGRVDRLEAA